jgi:nucleoside-diphosphate-sugar epimerase
LLKEKFDDFRVTYRPDFRDQIAATWPESLDTSDAARDWGFKADYTLIQMIEDMVENFQKAEKQKV